MLLTTNEACIYYRLSRKTIMKLAREGKIPAKKIGKLWRFYVSSEEVNNGRKNTRRS